MRARPEVMVFEPLWSVIPSNKAILPVQWEISPNNRYLLESRFQLTQELAAKGYVRKPIVGICGGNILLVDENSDVLEATSGSFADRDDRPGTFRATRSSMACACRCAASL